MIVMYLMVMLFTVCIVAYAMFWSTIVHRPGVCMTIIILTIIFMLVGTFVASNTRTDVGLMCAIALNPVSALYMGLQAHLKRGETNFQYLGPKTLPSIWLECVVYFASGLSI